MIKQAHSAANESMLAYGEHDFFFIFLAASVALFSSLSFHVYWL